MKIVDILLKCDNIRNADMNKLGETAKIVNEWGHKIWTN
jgi:hypothetical protein